MRAQDYDVAVVGAGFAGLACARAAARRGLSVLVVDRKAEPGACMHTTGLVVKEAAERWEIPATLTRRVRGIRLYAPSLAVLDLQSSGYYFLATDTPALMRWLAREAARAGAHLRFARPWRGAERVAHGFVLDGGERVRCVVGADGPTSAVAAHFGLGRNREYLLGVEGEYRFVAGVDDAFLHCFLDRRLAPGYIGWVVPGVDGLVQVGLACRRPQRPDLPAFERKLARLFDFSARAARRPARRPDPGRRPGVAVARARRRAGRRCGRLGVTVVGRRHPHGARVGLRRRAGDRRPPARRRGSARPRARANATGVRDEALAACAVRPRPARPRVRRGAHTRAFTALARSVYFHHRGLRSVDGWRDLALTLFRGHP